MCFPTEATGTRRHTQAHTGTHRHTQAHTGTPLKLEGLSFSLEQQATSSKQHTESSTQRAVHLFGKKWLADAHMVLTPQL